MADGEGGYQIIAKGKYNDIESYLGGIIDEINSNRITDNTGTSKQKSSYRNSSRNVGGFEEQNRRTKEWIFEEDTETTSNSNNERNSRNIQENNNRIIYSATEDGRELVALHNLKMHK